MNPTEPATAGQECASKEPGSCLSWSAIMVPLYVDRGLNLAFGVAQVNQQDRMTRFPSQGSRELEAR